jgi:thioesterase domain-containing protein
VSNPHRGHAQSQRTTTTHCESEIAMSVDTSQGRDQVEAGSVPKSVPVGRVIAGSLIAGSVIALVLSLAVFPGATESVITGSMLVAFGLGWAMMRVLSAQLTTQRQRWTTVPAVAMTATGAGLLLFSPQGAALSTLNWAWPPAMLALSVWAFIQMRRAMTGRGRWLLTPVLVVLAAASLGATVQDFSAGRVMSSYPAPGKSYSVGDHELHIDCHGTGGPTVVLFSGLGEFSASWARITDAVSTTTRVCAYDRAGQGWSDDVASPQDGVIAAADLHALLTAAGEHGPYVLVGHSIGGPYAMTYAATYPEQVAGMVLLDSSSPHQFTAIPSYPFQYAVMRRGLALLPTLARLGLGPVIASGSHLPPGDAAMVDAMNATPRAMRNGRDELSMIPKVFEQAQTLTTLGSRPLAVLTASENLGTDGWAEAQDEIAALSDDSLHRNVDSTHAGLVEDPHSAGESVRAITAVVHAVTTGSAIANP